MQILDKIQSSSSNLSAMHPNTMCKYDEYSVEKANRLWKSEDNRHTSAANEVKNFRYWTHKLEQFRFVQQCLQCSTMLDTKIINSNSRHSMETSAVSYKTKGYILFDKDELERRKKEFELDKKGTGQATTC